MFPGVGGVGEPAGGLDYDLGSDGVPRQGGGGFFFEDLNDFAVDRNTVGAGGGFVGQVAEDRGVLQQMGSSLGGSGIVDSKAVEGLFSWPRAYHRASNGPQ